MNLQWVQFTIWSLLNPICITASFITTNSLGMYVKASHAESLSMEFFPVYIFIGMLALTVQAIMAYAISRIFSKVTPAKVFEAFLSAQYPFVVMVLFVPAFISIGEWNVMGFIVGPLFLIISLITGGISCSRYFTKLRELIKNDESPSFDSKGIGGVVAVSLVLTLLSLWQFGSQTHLITHMGWRTDLPQYTVSKVIQAIKDKNSMAFTEYVDLDSLLSIAYPEIVDKTPLKTEILNDIENGKFLISDNEGLRFGEWVMNMQGASKEVDTSAQIPVNNFVTFTNSSTLPKATVNFRSAINGEQVSLSFGLQKKNGRYKIVGIDDFDKVKNYRSDLESFPSMVEKNLNQSVIFVKLINFSATSNSIELSLEVENNSQKPLIQANIAVVFRDAQTGEVIGVSTSTLFSKEKPIQPREKRQVSLNASNNNPILTPSVRSGRVKVAEVYPLRVFYEDRQYIDFLKIKFPTFSM